MSFIKDFNDLHFGVKGTLLNIGSTVPFFFIIVYLYYPSAIEKVEGNPLTDIDFYFVLAICFSISLLWFLMNFLLSFLTIDFVEWIESVDEEPTDLEHNESEIKTNEIEQESESDDALRVSFVASYVYSIGYLSIAIFINTWVGWQFKWFILSCFGFILFRLIWILIWYGIMKRIEKRTNGKVDR